MSNRIWHNLTRGDLPDLKEFLKDWEYRNTNLSRYFFSGTGNLFNLRNPRSLLLCRPYEKINGLLLKGPYGLFLPIFAFDNDFSDFGIPVSSGDFKTLMGTGRATRSAEVLFSGKIKNTVNYRLMKQESSRITHYVEKTGGIRIRRAGFQDAERLYPLQKAYELEEVILNPANFDPGLCMENLKKQLRNEIIFLAEINGEPVAKAGTNARGIYHAQLGGIFTTPAVRNMGISGTLVDRLTLELNNMGLAACLFVKPENSPAIRVYEKCGFTDMGDFRISYLYS